MPGNCIAAPIERVASPHAPVMSSCQIQGISTNHVTAWKGGTKKTSLPCSTAPYPAVPISAAMPNEKIRTSTRKKTEFLKNLNLQQIYSIFIANYIFAINSASSSAIIFAMLMLSFYTMDYFPLPHMPYLQDLRFTILKLHCSVTIWSQSGNLLFHPALYKCS